LGSGTANFASTSGISFGNFEESFDKSYGWLRFHVYRLLILSYAL
jgi:hypothetical protein